MNPTTDGRLPTPAHAGTPAADVTLMRALARGLHWQQLLDAGKVANIAELATAEGIDKVRVQKTLKLARSACAGETTLCRFSSWVLCGANHRLATRAVAGGR